MKHYNLITIFILLSTCVLAQPPYWYWAKGTGGVNGFEAAVDGVTDIDGNLYITGVFRSEIIEIDSFTLTNNGLYDIFLMKCDKNGYLYWVKSFGGQNDDYSTGIVIDSHGDIYLTGYHNSPTIDFGIYTLNALGGRDIFISKLSSEGDVIWSVSAGGNSEDVSRALAIDNNDNIFITGNYGNTAIFDEVELQASSGAKPIFIAKYDPYGNAIWALSSETDSPFDYVNAYDITVDNAGNAYFCGMFGNSIPEGNTDRPYIRFGNDTIWNNNLNVSQDSITYSSSALVLKFSGSGTFVMSYSDDVHSTGKDISVDGSGNIYQAQYTSTSTQYSGITFSSAFVKISQDGIMLWRKSFDDTGHNIIEGLCATESDSLYVYGNFSGQIIHDNDTLIAEKYQNGSYNDIFIAKYDNTGSEQWFEHIGGPTNESVNSIVFHSPDQIYLLGSYESDSLFFDDNLVVNESDSGSYFVHLNVTVYWRFSNFFTARMSEYPMGLYYPKKENQYSIIPCPASEKVVVRGSDIGRIQIFDTRGASIILMEQERFQNEVELNISKFPPGIYLLSITGKEYSETKKIIIE